MEDSGLVFNASAVDPELRLLMHNYARANLVKVYIYFNSPMMKKVLPAEAREKFRIGLTCGDGVSSLDELFLVPDAQAAAERVIAAMHEALKKRFENERSFCLNDETRICDDG